MWLRISSTVGEGLARVLRSNIPLSQSTASSNPSPVSALVELGDGRSEGNYSLYTGCSIQDFVLRLYAINGIVNQGV